MPVDIFQIRYEHRFFSGQEEESADTGIWIHILGGLTRCGSVTEGRNLPRMLFMKFMVQLVNLDSGLF